MAETHLVAKISDITRTGKPLVVLLKGPGKDSSMMEMILRTSGLATLRDQASLFVLAASDELINLAPVVEALKKASLPNIQTADLPVVLVLNDEGKALSVSKGLVTAGELQQSLQKAVAAFQSQDGQSTSATSFAPSSGSAAGKSAQTNTPGTQALAEPHPQAPERPLPAAASVQSQEATPVPTHQLAAPSPMQQTTPSLTGPAATPAAATATVDTNQTVQLQINLPDGENIRGSFKGSTLLQDVRAYIQQKRPDLNAKDYSIVSLHLGREFDAGDLTRSLAKLGVQSQTSLRLRNKQSPTGGHKNLLDTLMQLLMTFNPMSLVSWILSKISGAGAQYSRRDRDSPAVQQPDEQASGSSTARQNAYTQAMKRINAEARKVHTLHDDGNQGGSQDDPDGNSYWNGNSTKFDADE